MYERNTNTTRFLISHRKPVSPISKQEHYKLHVDRAKVASDLGFYPTKGNSHVTPANPPQLATFSSKKLMDSLQHSAKNEAHNVMLRKELKRFRSEIEQKYKQSHMNKVYHFPKPGFYDDEENYEANTFSDKMYKANTATVSGSDSRTMIGTQVGSPINQKPGHRKVVSSAKSRKEEFVKINSLIYGSGTTKSSPKQGTLASTRPFLMLSFRKPEEETKLKPSKTTTGISRANVVKKERKNAKVNFKKDLQEYFHKKEDEANPTMPRIEIDMLNMFPLGKAVSPKAPYKKLSPKNFCSFEKGATIQLRESADKISFLNEIKEPLGGTIYSPKYPKKAQNPLSPLFARLKKHPEPKQRLIGSPVIGKRVTNKKQTNYKIG